MRALSAVMFSLVLGSAADVFAQAPASARRADERALSQLEDQWAAALIKRDAAFFRRTLAADYVYSDERGVFSKEQVVTEQTSESDTVTYAANEDMRAHVHGDAAVVTGILVVRGRGKDGPFQHRYRFTDTWLRSGGRWVMIASQDYDIPAK